jgi:hypothetical protein
MASLSHTHQGYTLSKVSALVILSAWVALFRDICLADLFQDFAHMLSSQQESKQATV